MERFGQFCSCASLPSEADLVAGQTVQLTLRHQVVLGLEGSAPGAELHPSEGGEALRLRLNGGAAVEDVGTASRSAISLRDRCRLLLLRESVKRDVLVSGSTRVYVTLCQ